jgi:hypothetical protein
MKGSKCPACGTQRHVAISLEGDFRASPGDIAVCMACNATLIFDDDLSLQKPRKGELESRLLADPELANLVKRARDGVATLHVQDPQTYRPPRRTRR